MSAEQRNNDPVPNHQGSRSNSPPIDERGSQHHRNHNRFGGKREPRFEGKCEELKDSVCDMVTRKDTFTKTMWDIAEHVSRQFDEAGEFCTGMAEMNLLQNGSLVQTLVL